MSGIISGNNRNQRNHINDDRREEMLVRHLVRRGIVDPLVLNAFEKVPREEFVPEVMREFAYEDTPLSIGEGQTISQPYIVALTTQALDLRGGERVLEVGAGSGYAAAILGQIASEVYAIERIASLANSARERLARLGYTNVHIMHGDGTRGVPEHAPYDAIAVAAGGPKAPPALLSQLKIGGRLVIPIGPEGGQKLVRITRTSETGYDEEPLTEVYFVPLIGEHGWAEDAPHVASRSRKRLEDRAVVTLLREAIEPIEDNRIDSTSIDGLLDRIGDARLVLLGEATHGTSEFYRMRARITRELIERRGFQFVAVEADWPDAARIDDYVLGGARRSKHDFLPFERFPTWMWRNEEVLAFVEWLRTFNSSDASVGVGSSGQRDRRVGFHGLDLYSMFTSMAAVLHYLDGVDPDASRAARRRYALLTPWQKDPAAYGHAVLVGKYEAAEEAVIKTLRDMLERRLEYTARDGERFFDAMQNARVVASAELYYRSMYYGRATSWNLRDAHMFETLQSLRAYYGGANSKGVVWAHNSHVGDAAATEMSVRGEHNLGQLCRAAYPDDETFIVGFATDHGFVAAASDWDEPMQRMSVRPSITGSYERILHETAIRAGMLPLRRPSRIAVRDELTAVRLERAIGVVYRPETELMSHYFQASLARQLDELVWFDETTAVHPLPVTAVPRAAGDMPDTYPFGL